MLAALLHDVGKPATRSVDADGRIRFFNHDQVGAAVTSQRLFELRFSNEEARRAGAIVRQPSAAAAAGAGAHAQPPRRLPLLSRHGRRRRRHRLAGAGRLPRHLRR